MRALMLTAAVLVCSLSLLACMPKLPPKGDIRRSGTYKVTTDISTGGFRRGYTIHIPPGYDGTRPLPMVVVIHGAFDTASGMEKYSGFSRLADKENFIVLYPNGIGIMGYFQHWNAGHCCGKAQQDKIDDVGFIASAIMSAAKRLNVDAQRIYMLGFSNGGMITYRFAAERGEMLAAAAALAASIGSRTPDTPEPWLIPRPVKPLAFLIMHGTADTDVPFKGLASQRSGTPRDYRSVDESAGFWVMRNGCGDPEPVKRLYGGAAKLTKWSHCTSGQPVWLYALENWKHIWPGRYFTADLDPEDPLKDFDAAEIIWHFFNMGHSMPAGDDAHQSN